MTRNSLKSAMQSRRKTSGLWVSIEAQSATEIAAQSGADWVLLDMEHAPRDLSDIAAHLSAAESNGANMIVRPPVSEPVMIKRLLDLGARNLMFPMIETAEDAARAVSWTRYAPEGMRGMSTCVRANAFGRQGDYLDTYKDNQCVIVQVETPSAVANIPQIAAVDGVDAIFVGPGDLSAAMGYPGDSEAPAVQKAIAEALEMIHQAGIAAGILGYGAETASRYFKQGFEFVAIGGDTWLLAKVMDELVAKVRTARDA